MAPDFSSFGDEEMENGTRDKQSKSKGAGARSPDLRTGEFDQLSASPRRSKRKTPKIEIVHPVTPTREMSTERQTSGDTTHVRIEKIKRKTLTEDSELAPHLAFLLQVNTRFSTASRPLNLLDLLGFSRCPQPQCKPQKEEDNVNTKTKTQATSPPQVEIKGAQYVLKGYQRSDLEQMRLQQFDGREALARYGTMSKGLVS